MLRGLSEGLSLAAFPCPHSLLEGAGFRAPWPCQESRAGCEHGAAQREPCRDPPVLMPLALLDPASCWVQKYLQPLSLMMLQTAEPPASLSFPAAK